MTFASGVIVLSKREYTSQVGERASSGRAATAVAMGGLIIIEVSFPSVYIVDIIPTTIYTTIRFHQQEDNCKSETEEGLPFVYVYILYISPSRTNDSRTNQRRLLYVE